MKNKTFIAALLLAVTGLFSSCEKMFGDYLDKQPSNELTEEQVFSSWKNTQAYYYDIYNFLRNGLGRINGSWMDSATDLATTSFSTGGTRNSFNIGNYLGGAGAPELKDTWEHYYRGIRKCNTFLEKIDSVPRDLDMDISLYRSNVARMKSEVRFLRAYFYWELTIRYGAVPLILDRLNPENVENNAIQRPSSEKTCFAFILKELDECFYDLYNDKIIGSNDKGFITKGIDLALRLRVKLYLASPRYSTLGLATWQDAVTEAEDFIGFFGNGNPYMLTTNADPVTAYANAIIKDVANDGNKESIFWRNDPKAGYWQNEELLNFGGRGGLSPSQNLVDMYDMANGNSPFSSYDNTGAPVYNTSNNAPSINAASGYNDLMPYQNRDPRLTATVLYNGSTWYNYQVETFAGGKDLPDGNPNITPTGYYNRKYHDPAGSYVQGNVTVPVSSRNWIFIRYAEVLLNYAEAKNEVSGPTPEVFSALQQLRNRVGMTALLSTRSDLQTKDGLRKFIRRERTIELAFEDHRMWDLKRWNVVKEALARPIYGMSISKSGNTLQYTRKIAQSRVFEDKMYLYPIPEEEIWKTGINNNPGW